MLEQTGNTKKRQGNGGGRASDWHAKAPRTTAVTRHATQDGPTEADPPRDSDIRADILAGNEASFELLLEQLSPSLLRVARAFVYTRETAEEVVQETWIAVLEGIERFEGRSSLKTWIFSILKNRARTRAHRERRTLPFSSLCETSPETEMLVAEADRFLDNRFAWMTPRQRSRQTPEDTLLSGEAVALVRDELRRMPARQAEVVTLRDVEGWSSEEVCRHLDITESNQRVLLHRGRVCIRKSLDFLSTNRTAA